MHSPAHPTPLHHVVESLHVAGGNFFPELHLDFHTGHNDLIGEFGTGKSGVFHYVAYALGAPFVLPNPEDHDDYVKGTLGAGTITVYVRTRHGVRYKVVRRYGEPARVYAADGALADVSLDGELFKVHAYGAGALVEIARSPEQQLTLIDSFAAGEVRALGEGIERVGRDLAQNAVERRRLAIEIEEDEARTGELGSVAEALKGIGLAPGGGSAEESARALEQKIARGRERTAMTALGREIAAARASLEAFASGATRRLAATVEGDLERGANGGVFLRAHETVHRAAGAIEAGAGTIHAALVAAETSAEEHGRALAAAHAKDEDAYHALVVAEDADRARAAERERLHRRFEELGTASKRLADRRRELGERTRDRDALREKRALLCRERWAVRNRVAGELQAQLEGRISVRVAQAADTEAYKELLTELLRGASVHKEVIAEIAAHVRPSKLVALVEADDAGPIEEVDPSKTQKPARARKILATLRGNARLDELDTVAVGDLAQIALRIDGEYQPSNKVSIGQQCTCILPILLLHASGPLLIDQAEDNLDNTFIFDVLVRTISEVKKRRQLLFATHSANICVLDPGDRVFALVTKNGKGTLAAWGDVEGMREWIERILEGGREAFLRRGERYGHVKGGANATPNANANANANANQESV
jgi:hypothetical protein